MQMVCLNRQRRLHFVGIGGAGMSGIAELWLQARHARQRMRSETSATITRLASLGAQISHGPSSGAHEGRRPELDAVVISSAVKFSNPEVARAREMKIPVIARAEMLGELLRMARSASRSPALTARRRPPGWSALIMEEAGLDPTVAIGGNMRNTRQQRAPRPRRLHGGRGRRERRVISAADSDDRGRHQYRSRASRSLRHDGSRARGVPATSSIACPFTASRCSASTASTCAGCWRRFASRW